MTIRKRKAGLLGVLALAAVTAWGGILAQGGHLEPVQRWGYYLSGGSGPIPGYGIGPSPMVDVTGAWKGRSHCYT